MPQQASISVSVHSRAPCAAHSFAASYSVTNDVGVPNGVALVDFGSSSCGFTDTSASEHTEPKQVPGVSTLQQRIAPSSAGSDGSTQCSGPALFAGQRSTLYTREGSGASGGEAGGADGH